MKPHVNTSPPASDLSEALPRLPAWVFSKSCTEDDIDSLFPLSWGAMAGDDFRQSGAGEPQEKSSVEQRRLLIDAFTRTAAERGYPKTTVEEVTRRAGLSEEDFHEHFADVRHCLTAAYDAFVARLSAQVESAVDCETDWPEQVRTAVAAGIEFLVETASRARVFAVEAIAVGPPYLERYVATVESVAKLLRRGRERYPRAAELPDCTESVLIGGIVFRVRACLLAEEGDMLPQLGAEFVELLLRPYLGEREAKQLATV